MKGVVEKMDTVTLPRTLVEKTLTAGESFAQFSDELEDFLLSQDPKFIAKMRAAQASHLSGKTLPLAKLERKVAASAKTGKHARRRV